MDAKDKEKRPCKNKKRWELIEHESPQLLWGTDFVHGYSGFVFADILGL